jgi:hypothetical protein
VRFSVGGVRLYSEELAVASGENEPLPPDPNSRPDDTDLPPVDDTPSEPSELTEPIEAFADLSAEPGAEAAPPMEETEALESLSPESAETLQVPEPAEGVAETVSFEGAPSESGENLVVSADTSAVGGEALTDTSGSVVTVGEGSAVTTGESAGEGDSLAEGLASGVLGTSTITTEEAASEEGEESAKKADVEEEGVEKQPGVFVRLGAWIADTSVYNVLLFLAAVALVLGSLALVQELQNYNWDIKAQDAKRPLAAVGADYAPASTTAVA